MMADKDEGYDEFLRILAAAPPTIVDSQEKAVMENEESSKETCAGLTSDDDHGSSPPPSRLSNNQTRLLDHYSLPTPSSTMRFRSANVHVYDSQGSQLILEERLTTRNNSASNNSDETASLGLPNDDGKQEHANISTSSTVTNVTGGVIFIFAVGLLLFLVSDLAEQSRAVLYGVGDKTGTPLLYSFGYGVVLTSWMKFVFFVGIPAITLVSLLLSGNQEFYSVTLKELYNRLDMTNAERFKYTILTAEKSMLSGKISKNYIYVSDIYDLKRLESNSAAGGGSDRELYLYSTNGLAYIKLTQLMPRGLFITLDLPERCWTQGEVDFNIPIFTKNSWSLESVFCRTKNGNNIAMLSGPSALMPTQTFSSLVCYFFGAVFYILLVAGLLVFAQVSTTGRKEYNIIKYSNENIRMLKLDDKDEEINDKNNHHHNALFQKWEKYTVTKPTSALAWASFIFKNIFLSMIPFAYFCYSRNAVGAITYLARIGPGCIAYTRWTARCHNKKRVAT
eukprot:scaffold51297_cov52-Cyclotella_meneghiniana.AAC.5